MHLTLSRLCAAALLIVLTGCSGGSDGEAKEAPGTASTASESGSSSADAPPDGILAPADLPFEPTSAEAVGRAGQLTDATSSCLGTEHEVLFDEKWTVKAWEYSDGDDWDVVSAVITPPEGAPDAGIDLVRARTQECMVNEQKAKVAPLQLGGATYGYEIEDAAGGFDSARAYLRLDGGRLAQITVQEMASGQRATEVLKDLVATLLK